MKKYRPNKSKLIQKWIKLWYENLIGYQSFTTMKLHRRFDYLKVIENAFSCPWKFLEISKDTDRIQSARFRLKARCHKY